MVNGNGAGHTEIGVVDVAAPLDSFDFSTASRWELLVLNGGDPVARLAFPSPGSTDSAALARELIWPHVAGRLRAQELAGRLAERLQLPRRPAVAAPTCSVVLCTHGRPQHLPTALAGLARLDPAPLEVIVVDNAPGAADARAVAEARGFRYVREDRRGLDNARNAGIAAARGEVIAFTDDDCVHPPGWLRHLAEGFEDPMVAAVTGPAFPYRLDTPARERMERQASLTRGLRPRVLDWTLISPLHSGQAGVGANMIIRTSLLTAVAEPFPPELDAGTETRSGGDTYVFARLMAAGHRIAYDPRTFVFHQHRADWPSLDDAVGGYGTGSTAVLTKMLVEDGELEAPRAALWLLRQYLGAQRRRAVGRADGAETRIAWAYLRGALTGPLAWRRALRTQRRLDPSMRPARPFPPPTAAAQRPRREDAGRRPVVVHRGSQGEPAISVVIPTVERGPALERSLAALAAQTLPRIAFEVIVVDDSPEPGEGLPGDGRLVVHVHRTGGRGAAAARNEGAGFARGQLLLFLDDDLIPAPDLLERHVAAHETAEPGTVVIGCSPPRPPRPGLAALGSALWWEDQFRLMERMPALTFTEALSGNVSIARTAFADGRGFDAGFARLRREDWEWGFRLLAGGGKLVYEPGAIAEHEYELSAARRIRACRLEGGGDALLVGLHPESAPALPAAVHKPPSWRRPLRRLTMLALGDPRADALVVPALGALERARLRGPWVALYGRAQRAAYARGLREGGWRPDPASQPPLLEVELGADDPLPLTGPVSPRVRVVEHGRPLAEVDPRNGWQAELTEQLASQLLAEDVLPDRVRVRRPATVIFGPRRHPADACGREELVRTHVRVELVDGAPEAHWELILDAAERATTELIAVPFPGRRDR
jgi:glycosyltransferase involved in cell wall biosynthesis